MRIGDTGTHAYTLTSGILGGSGGVDRTQVDENLIS